MSVRVMAADLSDPTTEEAERLLTGLARGRFGAIDPGRIARHVLASSQSEEWAVRKAAFDALVRRFAFGRRDGLRIAARPDGGVLGEYATAATDRDGARPYRTCLYSLEPLRTSCSCRDFVRSSLGLCKHGMVILEALDKSGIGARAGAPALTASMRWDHQVPLRGSSDRLARLSGAHRASPPETAEARLEFIATLERTISAGEIEAEPAIATLLQEERARLELKRTLAPLAAAGSRALESLRRTLYPYQREGVQRFFETGRLLLADDMGLGKTTQAIAAVHGLFELGCVERALLVVPGALKAQWKREWDETSAVPLTLVDGSPKERARFYGAGERGCLAIGYEQLLRDLAQVQRFAPQLVVLDEAQRIKNWATKSARYVKLLRPIYRLVLTGTPMENRFDELASIVDFVDDLALEPKWRLAPFHSVPAGEGGNGLGGARHLDVLRERLSGTMLRRVRREVLAQLPPRTDTRVPVEMTEHQRDRHDELRQPIAELSARAERRGLRPGEFTQLMQLLTTQRMLCNGVAQVQFDSEWPRVQRESPAPEVLAGLFAPKLSTLRALVEEIAIDQRRKAVVFSQWRNMLLLSEWAVRDRLASAGLRALFFTGAESNAKRQQALDAFRDDPEVALLFLSDAGGVGLNLQHAASCCINLELPWNPAVLEQRVGRIYRLGQERPIDVYNLVTEEGIEGRIANLVAQKQAIFSTLFDGASSAIHFEGGATFLEGVKLVVDPLPLPDEPSDDDLPDAGESTALATESGEETATPPEPADRDPPASDAPAAARSSEIERRPDGRIRIELPGELAGVLHRTARGRLQIEATAEQRFQLAAQLEELARGLRG